VKVITYFDIQQKNISFIDKAKSDLFITASREVIEKWIYDLDKKIIENRRMKHYFMQNNNDYQSGTFLYSHCMLSAVKSVFILFDCIKKEKSEDAWMALIDTYDYLDVAELFLEKYRLKSDDFIPFKEKIKNLERTIFPNNLLYVSPGAKETLGECNICGSNFFDCNHIEREIYNGIFCHRINREILEADHIALVDNPRDRRCVIRTIQDKHGSQLDVFTRKRTAPNNEESEHIVLNVILHTFRRPEFN
jgi:hypothetical protein